MAAAVAVAVAAAFWPVYFYNDILVVSEWRRHYINHFRRI